MDDAADPVEELLKQEDEQVEVDGDDLDHISSDIDLDE